MKRIYIVGNNLDYARWIKNVKITNIPEEADIYLYTGGADVAAKLYGEKNGKYTYSNIERDKREFDFYNKYNNSNNKLNIGICRGAQFLHVMDNEKLIQHVTGHTNNEHQIETITGETFYVASDHHQMLLANKTDLIAWSKEKLSNIYLNGNNEEYENIKYETEICQKNNNLKIQFHPEWPSTSSEKLHEFLNYLVDGFFNFNQKENRKSNYLKFGELSTFSVSAPFDDLIEEI